ncbi:DUF262 domain-containing HNH endonuclease family protein [Pseudidiomarina sp. GXY010]|uniref:DUF262 domain-containing HNH endonuclease family protein n=1 Tax=Pseudidiomarina fusca TaxID=2965078 RepID=A0ABU3KW37_9GAMM|nr:DUF262 domain-containing HNH endonuclease family protein [Pseudidiomarina sp. GXY010]MDT7525106.1 DUF262 domain-containing HNH endonuclease family protein [Pseudidiomarina sp. GXY010]
MKQLTSHEKVQTELLTLEKINKSKIGFVVPSYQRPYVWKAEDALKLLDDIVESCKANEPHYFIGSSLSAKYNATDKLIYELIDGQQRITTLMLISIAFKTANIKSALAQVSILNDEPRLTFAIRESVRNLLGSYAGIKSLTKPGYDSIESDPYLKHLHGNLDVLVQQIEALSKGDKIDVNRLADYIFCKVSWVNNVVPRALDLNRLFSSMNTAGVQLEPVDLLKAKLFRKIYTEKSLYNKIWQACEHTNNYFERNLRQLFPNANWNAIEFEHLREFSPAFRVEDAGLEVSLRAHRTISELLAEVVAGDEPSNTEDKEPKDSTDDISDETVYCRSIISFELLLVHTLRIFYAQRGCPDLTPRIKSTNLMACFECLLTEDEEAVKAFLLLLWQVRFQFDKWVVKWVEHDDSIDPQLRLTYVNRPKSSNSYYINRSAAELSELVQLQAVLNFTGDRSAHYWLTALLASLVSKPNLKGPEVLATLEQIDNQLSLTCETQKVASFSLAKDESLALHDWQQFEKYLSTPQGTRFEHYWFQKLEYLLWKQGDKSDERLKRYRITSKNSIEHVHPQQEEYGRILDTTFLDAFGNLVLLSPGENSSYSNQTVAKKKADFASKPRYDSLKLKALFECYEKSGNSWMETQIMQHQREMIDVLRTHYLIKSKPTKPVV